MPPENGLHRQHDAVRDAPAGLSRAERTRLLTADPDGLRAEARAVRDAAHGNRVTFSPKVFIPLTMLCRDRCGYCTFAKAPARVDHPYLELDDVLAIARAGRAAGCHEALFTLGEAPRGPRTPWPGSGSATTASPARSTTWCTPAGPSSRRPGSCPTPTPVPSRPTNWWPCARSRPAKA